MAERDNVSNSYFVSDSSNFFLLLFLVISSFPSYLTDKLLYMVTFIEPV